MSAAYVGDGRLEPFRKVIDGYVLGPKARSIMMAYLVRDDIRGADFGSTTYHAEAEKLSSRGWLDYCQRDGTITRFTIGKGRGEAIRKELRDE